MSFVAFCLSIPWPTNGVEYTHNVIPYQPELVIPMPMHRMAHHDGISITFFQLRNINCIWRGVAEAVLNHRDCGTTLSLVLLSHISIDEDGAGFLCVAQHYVILKLRGTTVLRLGRALCILLTSFLAVELATAMEIRCDAIRVLCELVLI